MKEKIDSKGVESFYKKLLTDDSFAEKTQINIAKTLVLLKEQDPESYKLYKQTTKIRFALIKESDRGCVLLSCSYLEYYFGEYIKSYLTGNKKQKDNISRTFLSNFSNRIEMAYSIGLINLELNQDFNIIRQIRNEFAHSFDAIDFNNSKINSLIKKLNYKFRASAFIALY